MLATLHDTLHEQHKGFFHFFHRSPIFRFLIVAHAGQIRFFLETEEEHRHFLESQLYAHYPDIEISERALPLSADMVFQMQEARQHHITAEMIKLYVDLKDRTEKEVIDPLSSITSALSKCEKSETAFFRCDFSPLADKSWRLGIRAKIIENHLFPNWMKVSLLEHWWWLQVIFFPLLLIGKIFSFLMPRDAHEEHEVSKNEKNEHHKQETKFENFGYATRILVGASTKGKTNTREISTSLHIFSHPK